jgi:BirA family biotin operon repressor/biotin-[acetyl-CoA-carboxylase] ligase
LILPEITVPCQCGVALPHGGQRLDFANAADHRHHHRTAARAVLTPAAALLGALAPGAQVSGARLAAAAGVSRAAVWKQVQALRQRGVPIESARGAGYRLPWPIQMLGASRIAQYMKTPASAWGGLDVRWEVDSTSSELLRQWPQVRDLGFVLAETQSAGRGRRGRHWLSPPGLNLYLSGSKRFEGGFASLSGLSLAVGVMVLRALHALGIGDAGLKWPNDVLAGEGKLAGILVELVGDFLGPCTAVIGVGLNLRMTPELHAQAGQPASDLAGLCEGAVPDRNRVAATVLDALIEGLQQFQRGGFDAFVADYARHDRLRDQPLRVTGAGGEFFGTGAGVDGSGALRVRLDDGSLQRVDSADISVRRA